MNKGLVIVYYGNGKGKSSSAIGHAICAAGMGASVAIIQFLKGNNQKEIEFLKRLEPEVRLFSFEKNAEFFEELSEEQRQEEIQNIKNGLGFAKKVLVTGESTILVLDEILGLLEKGIVTLEDIKMLIDAKDEETELILTGTYMQKELMQYVDAVYEIKSIKEDE
jgi:cob(I)alamin adenosyltransferase